MVPIGKIISFLIDNSKLIMFALLVLFLSLFIQGRIALKEEKALRREEYEMNQKNLIALHDEIEIRLNKNNEEVFEKMGLVVKDIDDLKYLNQELYDDIKSEIGDLDNYIKTELSANLKGKGTTSEEIIQGDSSFTYTLEKNYQDEGLLHSWKSKTDFRFTILNGKITVENDPVEVLMNEFKINIELGTKVINDTTVVFAKSKSNLIQFNDIQSVQIHTPTASTINNKKGRFGLGFNIGIVVSTDGQVRLAVGAGLNYNIFRF